MNRLEKDIIEAYTYGSSLANISDSFGITQDEIKDVLMKFKKINQNKRVFTDTLKKVVAERDMNGVSRQDIASELNINSSTVRRACEAFGQSLKHSVTSNDELYFEVKGNFSTSSCPTCNSAKVNEVGYKAIFCKACGDEHIIKTGKAMRVNWDCLEE